MLVVINIIILLQLVRPVRWEQTLHALYSRPLGEIQPRTYTLGPGDALRTMLKKVNARAWDNSVQVNA